MGHPKSFFALYKPILPAGQRVCTFDRERRLTSGATAAALAEAVAQACATADCLLVGAEVVAGGAFPLAAFQQVVVYESEADSQAALRPHLGGLECPLHFLQVPAPAPPRAVPPPAAAPQAAPSAAPQPLGSAAGVARVQHAARPPATVVAGPQPLPGGLDWPVVISSDPCRPIRPVGCQGGPRGVAQRHATPKGQHTTLASLPPAGPAARCTRRCLRRSAAAPAWWSARWRWWTLCCRPRRAWWFMTTGRGSW